MIPSASFHGIPVVSLTASAEYAFSYSFVKTSIR